MKGGTQAALALGIGYVLGRRRKLRTASLMAAGAATGGLGSLGGAALRSGLKRLGSSEVLGDLGPQLGDLTETLRGDLVEAGKAAAIASVNKRISSLSDSLRDRADLVRNPAAGAADAAGQAGEAGEAVAGAGQRARRMAGAQGQRRERRRPDDDYEDQPEDEYQDEDDDYEEAPDEDNGASTARRRAPRRSPVSRTRR